MESEFILSTNSENICIKEEISEPDSHYPGANKGSFELRCTCDTTIAYDDINNGAVAPSTMETISGECNFNEHCTCYSAPQYGPCEDLNFCNICIKQEPIDSNMEDTYNAIHGAQEPDEELNQVTNNGGSDTFNDKNIEVDSPVLVKQNKQGKKRKNGSLNSDKIKVKIVECTRKTQLNQDNAVAQNKQKGAKKKTPYVVIKEKTKNDKLDNNSTKTRKKVKLTMNGEIGDEKLGKTAKSKSKPTKLKNKKKQEDLTVTKVIKEDRNETIHFEEASKVTRKVNGKFKCEVCQKVLSTKLSLKRHHERYHETARKMYSCTACARSFTRKDKLKYHLKNLCPHGDSRDPKSTCEICKLSFYDVRSVQRHLKNRHFLVPSKDGFTCQKCDVTIESLDKFNCHPEPRFTQHTTSRHMSTYYNKTCEVCELTFDSIKDLQYHMPTHCKEGNYPCNRCDAKYSRVKNLLRHIRQVHSVQTENFVCAVCDKSFVRKDVLRKHMLSHTDAKEFVCKICQKTFNRRDCMMSHMKRIHVPDSEKKQYKKEVESCCHTCGSVFPTAFLVRDHIMIFHEGKAVECKLCGYQCLNRITMYNHVKTEHGKRSSMGFVLYRPRKPGTKAPVEILCEFCNKRLRSKYSYKTHVRLAHPENYEQLRTQWTKAWKIKKQSKNKLVKIETKLKKGKSKKYKRLKSPINTGTNVNNMDETAPQQLNNIRNTVAITGDKPTDTLDKIKLCNIIGLQTKENPAEHGNIFETFDKSSADDVNKSIDVPDSHTISKGDSKNIGDVIDSYETDFEDCESD